MPDIRHKIKAVFAPVSNGLTKADFWRNIMVYIVRKLGITPVSTACVTDGETVCNGCVTDGNLRIPAPVAECNGVTDGTGGYI